MLKDTKTNEYLLKTFTLNCKADLNILMFQCGTAVHD